MKIGIVSQSYYPRPGGVTEVAHFTARELRRLGHEVKIITTHYSGPESDDPNVIRIGHNVLVPVNGAWVNMTVGFSLRGELRRIFDRERFDIIHAHCPLVPTLPLMSLEVARAGQKVVGTFHAAAQRNFFYWLFRRPLSRRIRRLDLRMAVSEAASSFAGRYFPGNFEILPNGIDCTRFKPGLEPIGRFKDGRFNVLFVGRMDPRKGVPYLFRAMPAIARELGGAVRFLIVGEKGLRTFLCPKPMDMHGAEVACVGHVSAEELPRYYATADVFCSPATGQESFGIVLLEAMASAVPIVASDIPGYRTILTHGREGLLVPPKDPGRIAQAIVALARDGGMRKELALRGREKAIRYDWPIIVRRLEEIYHGVLGSETIRLEEEPSYSRANT
ncbi:MAG: glycosyltransferase family 4 protein [Candidatus Krumholzibacteria bacterium]|nr:glycosyltransferase family 4 protein [Candidatus Krumholzibacteria bacterium]